MKKEAMIVLVLILFSLIPFVSAQVRINEVMPDPDDNCYDCTEWVELYSNSSINLSGWKFSTNDANKFLVFENLIEDYLIITKNKGNFSVFWPFVNQSKIIEWKNMSLTNSGDKINLTGTSGEFDEMTYSQSNENKTWALNSSNLWQICSNPTPGQQNNCELPQQNQTNQTQPTTISSYIEIQDYPEEAKFGDSIDIKVNIFRGDTSKYAVYSRVEQQDNDYDVSEETTIHVFTKYVNYSMKIPVQIKLNCDGDYENETYKIIVEGLDVGVSKNIKLSGKSSLCPKEEKQETQESTEEKTLEETNNESVSSGLGNIETPMITGDIIYSKGTTTLKITPYLLSLLCLFIAFYTIKTRWQKK